MSTAVQRKLPIGSELYPDGAAHFRVWAPRRSTVEVISGNKRHTLTREEGGYFSAVARTDRQYRFLLDGKDGPFPDPASRSQPDGPHGASELIDPLAFKWTDAAWRGVRIERQVIYEIHIGTFTPQGTWKAAIDELPRLADLGITLLEVMPVATFPGRFGWGYDGVGLFAPVAIYGTPDDFRSFVDAAHRTGLGVILDVVYNHIGPDGNYLREFSDTYFTDRYVNEWGDPVNFDGPGAGGVREFVIANAQYWIDEFHLDGLRLDATQQIFDASPEHIVKTITRAARAAAAGRDIVLIGENEPQEARLVRELGVDALWNDDFHHCAHVALTRRNEAYYSDYHGTPQELISALKWGFLYQGQRYSWQRKPRGTTSFDLKPASFVTFIQNHDQVANTFNGQRISRLTNPARYRTLAALLLLGPGTPMLFQGQEFGATTPFLYFADHNPEMARMVAHGREEFMRQFASFAASHATIVPPHDPATFKASKLDPAEAARNAPLVALHRDLIALRREDAVFRAQRSDWMHGSVLGAEAFALRFFGGAAGDRLIVVNLGRDLALTPVPEPLLSGAWQTVWSSEAAIYGGCGRPPLNEKGEWFLTGESATVLKLVGSEL